MKTDDHSIMQSLNFQLGEFIRVGTHRVRADLLTSYEKVPVMVSPDTSPETQTFLQSHKGCIQCSVQGGKTTSIFFKTEDEAEKEIQRLDWKFRIKEGSQK